MLANWGYKDGSGEYFITIDTDRCDGCGKCVDACPNGVLEVGEDPADPLRDTPVVFVSENQRKKLKFACSPCKSYITPKGGGETGAPSPDAPAREVNKLPCVAACDKDAISHSW